MKYLKTISALLISGLLISACSSKDKKAATTTTTDPVTVTEKAAIPVKVTALSKTKFPGQLTILLLFFLLRR